MSNGCKTTARTAIGSLNLCGIIGLTVNLMLIIFQDPLLNDSSSDALFAGMVIYSIAELSFLCLISMADRKKICLKYVIVNYLAIIATNLFYLFAASQYFPSNYLFSGNYDVLVKLVIALIEAYEDTQFIK